MARIKDLAAWREAKMKEEFLTNMAFLRAHDPVAADVLEEYLKALVNAVLQGEEPALLTDEELDRRIAARRGNDPDNVA